MGAVCWCHPTWCHGASVILRIKGSTILHLDGILQHVIIKEKMEGTSTNWGQLPQHDVLTHARHPVSLSIDGSPVVGSE